MESLPAVPPPLSPGEVGDSRQVTILQQRLQEAEILLESAQIFTAATDRLQLLASLTTAAHRLCTTDGFVLALFSPEGEGLELLSQTDPSLHTQWVPLEEALAREVLQVGWPVAIGDLSRSPLSACLLHTLQGLGYTSLVVVPLKITQRITGVALASWRTGQTSFLRSEELLQTLANQAAQHLTRIHAQEEQERHLRTSEALRRIGQSISSTLNLSQVLYVAAEEGASLLHCEMGVVSLCAADDQVEVVSTWGSTPPWEGLQVSLRCTVTGQVKQERRALRQTDFAQLDLPLFKSFRALGHENPPSFLSVPLWQHANVIGALSVLTLPARIFSLADERILQTVADQVVQAIANAQIHAQLQDALHREQEESQRKSTFFAGASHELRTPLNIILGYVDLLRDGHIGSISPQVTEILNRVRQATLRLTTLVNDLLTLARLERAEFDFSVAPVNIDTLIAETYADWEQPIRKKGLAFLRAGDSPLPKLTTDKTRVRQILDNLLGNAHKFTQHGHITIGTQVSDQTLQVWVEDTGSGIEEADQQRIFDEFQRVRQKTTIQPKGAGLGLAVCKRLAYLLGGSIHVESTPNQGSTFTLVLPFHESERPNSVRDGNKNQDCTT